jgi:hypothetical protein
VAEDRLLHRLPIDPGRPLRPGSAGIGALQQDHQKAKGPFGAQRALDLFLDALSQKAGVQERTPALLPGAAVEHQGDVADADHVPRVEGRPALDRLAVDLGAVVAVKVRDLRLAVGQGDAGMAARDRAVGQAQIGLCRPADQHHPGARQVEKG